MDIPENSEHLQTWGSGAARLLRTMRMEAARSGHGEALPVHLLIAVADQPGVYQALRAIHQRPDVYRMRGTVAETQLGPAEFSEEIPLSRLTETLLAGIRPRRDGEGEELLYLLVLKAATDNRACRVLMEAGRMDVDFLQTSLASIS